MRTFLAFIKWIFVKVGEGLVGVHEGFKYELRNNTGMAIFAWFIVSFLTTIATLLILGAIQHFGRNTFEDLIVGRHHILLVGTLNNRLHCPILLG